MINFVSKHKVKKFSVISSNGGVILCERESGAFITLRYSEDVENLKKLINSITVSEQFKENTDET